MRLPDWLRRTFALVLAVAALFTLFVLAVRPWYLSWGATPDELRRTLPGDEIIAGAREEDTVTRAITIRAPLARVWAWVAQLGQDRGGFYSYALLENLVGCEMENAERIRPEWQSWRLGDKLWMYPEHKAGGMGHALLLSYQPGHALGFATRLVGTKADAPYDGSWSFVVEPLDDRTTRLIVRSRAGGARAFFGAAFDHFVFEPVHFVMERKMLKGIQARAEGKRVSEAADVTQVAAWTAMFGLMIAAVVLVFRRARWGQPLLVFVAAAVAFQYMTLRQPSPFVSAALVIAVAVALWPFRGSRSANAAEERGRGWVGGLLPQRGGAQRARSED
jgi:hypothetical protein